VGNTEAVAHATYRWIVAWLFILALLVFVNKTRSGHVIIYYSLVLMVMLVMLTEAPFIVGILEPIGKPAPIQDPVPDT